MPTRRTAENPELLWVDAVGSGVVADETNCPVNVLPDFRNCEFGLAPVNNSEECVSPLDKRPAIQHFGCFVNFVVCAEPTSADDEHNPAIVALGQGLKNVQCHGQAVFLPVIDFLRPLKKCFLRKSNWRIDKNEGDN